MIPIRERLRRAAPPVVRRAFTRARDALARPPLEEVALHGYRAVADPNPAPRLTLVLPSVAPERMFGGVSTGLQIFLTAGRRTGADLRVLLDDVDPRPDWSGLEAKAKAVGVPPERIEVITRRSHEPEIAVRRGDVFMTYNWWTTLNVATLIERQAELFGLARPLPFIYLIQEYEPQFYPFSSTHLLARQAFNSRLPYWGLFNSSSLHAYFTRQGHVAEQAFVFEPWLDRALKPYLAGDPPRKDRVILVYGRPGIPRNCFPAVAAGLRRWVAEHPQFADWSVVSAGMAHDPIDLGAGRSLRSLGKLDLEAYAQLLRRSAVGLSLMSSPHPSYPPLEMAHFGLLTITNTYADKDLATAHDGVLSVDDTSPGALSAALAAACARFEAAPDAGWRAPSHLPSYLRDDPYDFVDDLAEALADRVWSAPADIS